MCSLLTWRFVVLLRRIDTEKWQALKVSGWLHSLLKHVQIQMVALDWNAFPMVGEKTEVDVKLFASRHCEFI